MTKTLRIQKPRLEGGFMRPVSVSAVPKGAGFLVESGSQSVRELAERNPPAPESLLQYFVK